MIMLTNLFAKSRARLTERFPKLFVTDSIQQTDNQDVIRSLLSRLILLRVLILSALLLVVSRGVLADGRSVKEAATVFAVIAAVFALSGLNALVLRGTTRLDLLGCVQLCTDVCLATWAVALSGSPASCFLYLLVIVGAALLQGAHGAVIVASLSALAYTLLQAGILPSYLPPTPAAAHEIFLVYFSFIVVALLSAMLASYLKRLGSFAETKARDLAALHSEHQQLFEDISDGIVTCDLESVITGINQAARSILGLSRIDAASLVGRKLPQLLKEYGASENQDFFTHVDKPQELSFDRRDGKGVLHLRYLVRPLKDREGDERGKMIILDDLSRLRNVEERLNLHEKMTQLLADKSEDRQTSPVTIAQMIGESSVMKNVFALVERVATSEASVLITGESGTGKELIARGIHASSPRRSKPFVAINCGAIPESLLESELFGHKKGSFTGAIQDNLGLFRQANGGTIFLDEIGELPGQMQTKLLRVLQERKVRPVGDVLDYSVDVRVVAATNRDLKKEIKAGEFREDLFYRLNVVNIFLPPLRERREDVPLLVRHFIGKYCGADQVLPQISPEAVHLLLQYPFPGNIRELENVIERAIVLGGSAILPEHLPDEVRHFRDRAPIPSASDGTSIVVLPLDLEAELATLEKRLLLQALDETGGVKKQAAELLGLNFRSFRYRLKKYGLSEETDEL